MAPNNGYIRDVLKLAKARKIRVNVLDPSHDWSKDFPETVVNKKLNPFYIPENLSEKDRNILINNRARVFSEVIVSINEQSKEGDVYFRDINLAMTTNIATVVMAAKYMMGQQTELLEIQACIDNPELLRPYIATIEEKRGKVKASAITGRANASSNAANNFDHANTKREIENTARALAEDDSSIRPVAEGMKRKHQVRRNLQHIRMLMKWWRETVKIPCFVPYNLLKTRFCPRRGKRRCSIRQEVFVTCYPLTLSRMQELRKFCLHTTKKNF